MTDSSPDFVPSDLLSTIAPSATTAITQAARAMVAKGDDVVSLSVGEPDFDPPAYCQEAVIAAVRAGEAKYTTSDGTPALKAAIREKFQRDQGVAFGEEEVTATSGGKFLIYAALMASLNPGQEAIIPAPYWVSYPEIVKMTGATPVVVPTEAADGFRLTPDALKAAINSRTRWLFLNAPGNPTGVVYSPDELDALAEVLRDHPWVWLMSDDVYEPITYEQPFTNMLTVAPDLKDRTLIVHSLSKSHGATGWRLGFGAAPVGLVSAIRKLLGQTTGNPSSLAQAAGVAALTGDQSFLQDWRDAFRRRRDMVVGALNEIDGIECDPPAGAFYVFPSVEGLIGTSCDGRELGNDVEVASALLKAEKVATVPGTAFGMGGRLRLSFATDDATLADGMARLATFAKKCS